MTEIPRNKQVFDNGTMMLAIRRRLGIEFEMEYKKHLYTILTDHDEICLNPDIAALRAGTKSSETLVLTIK
jgi:hypothetical protein